MDVKELKRLMDAMKATGTAELELEWDGSEERPGGRVALRRDAPALPGMAATSGVPASSGAAVTSAAAAGATSDPVAAATPAAGEAAASAEPKGTDVVAPIVGTFYAAPSPDAQAFVRAGDRVKVGQVLCVIEAMKLMNEIEAEVAGTVVEILVRNEDPVEYGQVLMRIAPA
ncbi:MAG: acetyl-CoA carboxylase biotin carboxyl carrier protein [Trueperaceae bacterium]|nr:acetyl-CoA carboxylase biotin carboxyl carrier protein [Trueperaceae bacterium]